jgi:membrane fusion protein (multidrug efflux system)
MLAVGTPVVVLVDNSVLEFRASVPSSDYAKLRVGVPTQVTADSIPGFKASGSITHILPLVDERSRSFEVIVQVPGRRELISGLFARATVKVRDIPDAVVVPPASLVHDGSRPGMANIFVVENGKAESHEVGLGVEGLDAVQVRNGLKPGMLVVVDPPTTLASGVPVETSRTDR